jgi:hypothetical protein
MPLNSLRSCIPLLCVAAVLAAFSASHGRAQPPGQDMAVAYIVQTITLRAATVRIDPRPRPQRDSPSSDVIAATRIEVPAGAAVDLSQGQIEQLAYAIADTAEIPLVGAVQIDFDATIAQRCFYRDLIHRVRALLPAEVPLSITAIASWCMDDDWVSDLPIEEVVPMLRTAADWKAATARARTKGRPIEGPCRAALSIPKEKPEPHQ